MKDYKPQKWFWIFILVFLLAGLFTSSVFAATRPEVRFTANGATIGCASGATFVNLAGPFVNVDNGTTYSFRGIVSAGGKIYEDSTGAALGSSLNNPSVGWRFEAGNSGGSVNASFPLPDDTPYMLRFVLNDSLGNPSWVAIVQISKCNGGAVTALYDFPYTASANSAMPEAIVDAPPDNRINWGYGDAHIGILYPGQDGAINLYTYDDDRYISDFVTPDMLESYEENLPDQPVILATHGIVSVYLLPDGMIQFNLGPDREGKWYEVRLNGLSDREIDGSYFDPNE